MQHNQLPARRFDVRTVKQTRLRCATPTSLVVANVTRKHSISTPAVTCKCSSTTEADAFPSVSPADISAAWTLLKTFTEQEVRGKAQQFVKDSSSRAKLRDALMLAYSNANMDESWNPSSSREVLLGIVASEGRLAVRALRDWCQALELEYVQPDCKVTGASSLAAVQGAVYIKYNSTSKVCYLTSYKGVDRGVLVQLGSGRLLGHFPLGLFDEQMKNAEPTLGPQVLQQQEQNTAAKSQQG